jgi:hypothetical protein
VVAYPSVGGIVFGNFTAVQLKQLNLSNLENAKHSQIPGEDRCQILMQIGATWYERVDDCTEIPKTLDEGYQKGKKYEELLRKMDDKDYRERWVDYLST